MRSEIRQCEFLVCHVSCSLTVKLESGFSNLWFYGVEQIGKTSFSEASYNGFQVGKTTAIILNCRSIWMRVVSISWFSFEILNLDFSQINSTKDNFNNKDNYL